MKVPRKASRLVGRAEKTDLISKRKKIDLPEEMDLDHDKGRRP
jgi:hypothetical protein